jgi:CHAD domain-containing protein
MLTRTPHIWPDSATIMTRSREIFFSRWEELLRLRSAVLDRLDGEDIHDLRVASRRFRAALELFYPFAPKGAKTELKKSVRKLTRTLGELRNIDEAQLFLQRHTSETGQPDATIRRKLAKLARGEQEKVCKALKNFDHAGLDRSVRNIVAGLNETVITKHSRLSMLAYFSEVSIKLFLPIHQLLQEAKTPEHRKTRHALRIAIKKWRYFLEIVAPVLERDYSPLLDLLKEYQTLLGQLNDLVEFDGLLGEIKLPHEERRYAETVLKSENALLLERLAQLADRSPLTYTFLI